MNTIKTGAELIAEERQRQIDIEGWNLDHDMEYSMNELAYAAISYATPDEHRIYCDNPSGSYISIPHGHLLGWPWEMDAWKPSPANRIRELAKAGALIAAEIDRLQADSK
jgi:hypothetical protein